MRATTTTLPTTTPAVVLELMVDDEEDDCVDPDPDCCAPAPEAEGGGVASDSWDVVGCNVGPAVGGRAVGASVGAIAARVVVTASGERVGLLGIVSMALLGLGEEEEAEETMGVGALGKGKIDPPA